MTPFIVKRPSLAVCPKTEHQNEPNVRNPNDIVPNKYLFGFQRRSVIRRSVFGRLLYSVWKLTVNECLESILVQITDTHCILVLVDN